MVELEVGSKVRLLRGSYSEDDISRPYYVKRLLDSSAAILTTRSDLSMDDHTSDGSDLCLCYPAGYFEPWPSSKTKGFVDFIRKLEGTNV
jgi:hypothetical protein